MKIATFSVLVILFLLCEVGVAGRYQSFSKLGDFHQHVSYASVGVTFDFGPFSEYLTSIVKSLEGAQNALMTGYGNATVSRLLASVQGIDDRISGYYHFFKAKSSHKIAGSVYSLDLLAWR